jgi:hypothetical protein
MQAAMHSELVCANCGIQIRWQATVVAGQTYCCLGCAQGGPCDCDYDNLPQADRASAIVVQRAQKPESPESH